MRTPLVVVTALTHTPYCHPQVFDNALQCLNEEDRHLRPVVEMRLMLKAGVGAWLTGCSTLPFRDDRRCASAGDICWQ